MQHKTNQEQSAPQPPQQPEEAAKKTTPQSSRRVRCNGGAEGSGHPVVYLSLNDEGFVVCPYCSRRFDKNV